MKTLSAADVINVALAFGCRAFHSGQIDTSPHHTTAQHCIPHAEHEPPQSTPVSSPFCCPSEHVAGNNDRSLLEPSLRVQQWNQW